MLLKTNLQNNTCIRVIFDTNIYGLILDEQEFKEIGKSIAKDPKLIVYGLKTLRKELRDTPKNLKMGQINKRCRLLSLYDRLVKQKTLTETQETEDLAKMIYRTYRKEGGIRNWDKTNINRDLIIMACALINKIDIVISDNLKTLFSTSAKKAYQQIASKKKLILPVFWTYSDLRKRQGF